MADLECEKSGEKSPEEEKSPPPSCPTVSSREILRGGREARIVHGDEVYRLILTRNHKLILQK